MATLAAPTEQLPIARSTASARVAVAAESNIPPMEACSDRAIDARVGLVLAQILALIFLFIGLIVPLGLALVGIFGPWS